MLRRRSALRSTSRSAVRRILCSGALLVGWGFSARAQGEESPQVMRALELESTGKYREAATLFRSALRATPTANALLGLERSYAEIGATDSLLPLLDTLIAARPRDPLYRTVQLRSYQLLHQDERLRGAFERWAREVPRDVTPYREYARILLQLNRPASADSIVARGRVLTGGSSRELQYETAQSRAAMGAWVPSAQAWRSALTDAPHLAGAAAFSLAPAPAAVRDSLRSALARPPAEPGPRRALAELELTWGRPQEGWDALRTIPADTTAATMWEAFGDRAYAEERWTIARDALSSALRVRRTAGLAQRAATAALKSGAPAEVFTLVPLAEMERDPASTARDVVPLHVNALIALGRPAEADALIARFDQWLAPGQRMRLASTLASAWMRAGDLPRARAALASAGAEADSSEAAGWLALYEGRLRSARQLLRSAREPGPELAFALGVLARTRSDSAPELGAAFLALARGDSAGAATRFVTSAAHHPEAAPALLLVSARLQGSQMEAAIPLWQRVVAEFPASPEAVESELEWARALRRRGDAAGAITHLEHLILSAPQSALLPLARRELEMARGAVPPGP